MSLSAKRLQGFAIVVALLGLMHEPCAGGDQTNVPLTPGTAVTILTANRTFSGIMLESPSAQWISVQEPMSNERTLIPFSAIEAIRTGLSGAIVPEGAVPPVVDPRALSLDARDMRAPTEPRGEAIPENALAVVSWNVQTGATSGKEGALRPQLVHGALSRILNGKYQILAAQEIANSAGAEMLRLMLPGKHDAWADFFTDTTDNMDNGFWYRTDLMEGKDGGVLFVGAHDGDEKPETDPNRSVHPPHMAHFTFGDFDFTLITVHLTFRGGHTEESAKELVTLLDFLDEYFQDNTNDPDVIICGDFNTPADGSGENGLTVESVLHDDGRFEFGPHALHVLVQEKTSRSSAATGGKPAHNYDHFIVSQDCFEELIEAKRLDPSVFTSDPRDPKQTRTSDHFPIAAFFRADAGRQHRDRVNR